MRAACELLLLEQARGGRGVGCHDERYPRVVVVEPLQKGQGGIQFAHRCGMQPDRTVLARRVTETQPLLQETPVATPLFELAQQQQREQRRQQPQFETIVQGCGHGRNCKG
jgi:hypothetical protein